MSFMEQYQFWLENEYFDEETKRELREIMDNEKEIEDRFYSELAFGTAGLRGIMGAGTNRMNIYTVRRTTQGLANYINKLGQAAADRGVAISFDSRYNSETFAKEAAKVLAGNGVRVYLFESLRPTPELSFAVRELGAIAGIMITASHNPKQYNGYKVYWEDGGQLPPEEADQVTEEIRKISDYSVVELEDFQKAEEKGLIQIIGKEIDDRYIEEVKKQSLHPELVKAMGETMKVVYTPLHGTGNIPVQRILSEMGLKNVFVVKEQEKPDPDFPTVKYPNPEEREAFALAIELAEKEDVDLIIGTDPDADRIGVVVRNKEGRFVNFTGNQTGVLLTHYILSQLKEKGKLPSNGVVIKTIVTSEMVRAVARKYNVRVMDVLTGFKFIGEKIKEFEETGEYAYLFGFEESYGYLAGTHARDKDAVVAAMLICEAACYYKSKGMTLYEALQNLYSEFGYYRESLQSFTLEGKEGLERIKETMRRLREEKAYIFGQYRAKAIRDYLNSTRYDMENGSTSELKLPVSDVLYYELGDGWWFCIRPSGTEPKIKIYFSTVGVSREDSEKQNQNLKDAVLKVVKEYLFG